MHPYEGMDKTDIPTKLIKSDSTSKKLDYSYKH